MLQGKEKFFRLPFLVRKIGENGCATRVNWCLDLHCLVQRILIDRRKW